MRRPRGWQACSPRTSRRSRARCRRRSLPPARPQDDSEGNAMTRIAVLTSGGDAPGMNAAVRAITRCAIDLGWEVLGVKCGYAGLIDGDFEPLTLRSVAGLIGRGGTFLGSARSPEFRTDEGRRQALANLRAAGADALIVIGGNGSQAGASALADLGFRVVGVASTIDNDLAGSDVTIGVDTALNIALEAIDRITTTAASHHRAFLVEVTGRGSGYLALMTGIAGGAEVIVIPEALITWFREHEARIGFDLRATMLGHVQRGGDPTAYDRLLATRLGAGAVEALERGESGVLVGMIKGEVTATPYR